MAACHPSQIVCPQEGQRGLQAWRVAWVLRCGCVSSRTAISEASRRGAVKARGSRARCSSCSSGKTKAERKCYYNPNWGGLVAGQRYCPSTFPHIKRDFPTAETKTSIFGFSRFPVKQKSPHNFANAPIKGTTNVRQVMVAEWARLTEAEMVSPKVRAKPQGAERKRQAARRSQRSCSDLDVVRHDALA
jgi:hypothetical protein